METTNVIVSPKALKVIGMVRNAIAKSPTGVSFFSIKGYKNQQGETADYVFNIGASYENAKAKDIEILKTLDITKGEWKSPLTTIAKAHTDLLNAAIKPNAARSEGQKDAYTVITDGVKVHNETGVLYIFGNRISKTVIVEGEYKADTRSDLTKAKDEIRKLLKTTNFRQFIVSECDTIKGGGDTLEIQF